MFEKVSVYGQIHPSEDNVNEGRFLLSFAQCSIHDLK